VPINSLTMSDPIATINLSLEQSLANLDHGYEMLLSIAEDMIEDLPILVEEIRKAIDGKDSESAVLMSFTIKGLASNFQVQSLMNLAAKMESEYSILSDLEKARLARQIAIESERTIFALRQEFGISE